MDTVKLAALIAAADAGSLTTAAAQLGTHLATISRQIADLESLLGEPLLIRTGRGVRPTAVGERYIERARHILQELDSAAAEVRGERGATLRHLRLSAPVELSLRVLPPVLADLMREFPALTVDAHSAARQVSLLEEDYDAAIRLGPLRDSELLARSLGPVTMWLCGREAVGLAALASAEFAVVAGASTTLVGTHAGRSVTVDLRGRCRVGTFTEAAELAARSDLLVLLPNYTAIDFVAAGRLVRSLPALVLPGVEVHLIHPQRHRGAAVLESLCTRLRAALAARAATV